MFFLQHENRAIERQRAERVWIVVYIKYEAEKQSNRNRKLYSLRSQNVSIPVERKLWKVTLTKKNLRKKIFETFFAWEAASDKYRWHLVYSKLLHSRSESNGVPIFNNDTYLFSILDSLKSSFLLGEELGNFNKAALYKEDIERKCNPSKPRLIARHTPISMDYECWKFLGDPYSFDPSISIVVFILGPILGECQEKLATRNIESRPMSTLSQIQYHVNAKRVTELGYKLGSFKPILYRRITSN